MGAADKVEFDVAVGETELVVVGFAFTGRSIWSLGTEPGIPVSDEPGAMVVVLTIADMTSWSSSSCSVGMGRSVCLEASMHSPHRLSFQSANVPLNSLTLVSLTMTVQLPMPDSPLGMR